MDTAIITGLAAVLGSLSGAMASIATTWMTQHAQKNRERAQLQFQRREVLYGEFISESLRLSADALENTLEHSTTFANLHAILGRMYLMASPPVLAAAETCSRFIVDSYAEPNQTIQQIHATLREFDHPLKAFASACREEMEAYTCK
ncbi:MAG: hypothetical protein ACRCXD_17410 [Luteolibacter sp.]